MFILISSCSFVASRDFHLAHRDLGISTGSWVAVEPNGTRLPSKLSPLKLGAELRLTGGPLPVDQGYVRRGEVLEDIIGGREASMNIF